MNLGGAVRLNKFISDSGHCSRREADRLIESNRVKINGKRPELGSKVGEDDEVTVDGMVIYGSSSNKSDRVYLAYNKPVGITCTTELNVKGNIIDAVDHDERIFPIGRLDKPSDGLILLTSDGDIVNKILRAENAHDKEYFVTVDKNIAQGFSEKMSAGVPILGTVTKPCKVTVQGKSAFKITLTEGLNRQIRRMCEYLGYEVVTLTRLRIMNIELGKLRSGQWRKLTREELAQLNSAISSSSSEASDKPKRSGKPSRRHSKAAESPGKKKFYPAKGKAKSKVSRGQERSSDSREGNRKDNKKGGKRTAAGKQVPKGRTFGGKVAAKKTAKRPPKKSPKKR